MNNEIKINKANKSLTFINNGIAFSQFGLADEILDLITNLQQEKPHLHTNTEWEDLLDYKGRTYIELERFKQVKQENEKLKELCDKYEEEHSNEFKIWKEERHELLDYKSRCEKASECIKKDTRWFDSEYARVYGELCDCAGAKGDRLEVMVNPSNALNILQNGSDESE